MIKSLPEASAEAAARKNRDAAQMNGFIGFSFECRMGAFAASAMRGQVYIN